MELTILKSKNKIHLPSEYLLVGWQEWCILPKLGIPAIKAKIDTGAKTSAIHAFNIQLFYTNDIPHVRFEIYPLQGRHAFAKTCTAVVIDQRLVMSSNGHKELRYVIMTPIVLAGTMWEIEVTLSNRDPLTFRMLLGREALQSKVIIDPHRKLCQGSMSLKELKKIYNELEN